MEEGKEKPVFLILARLRMLQDIDTNKADLELSKTYLPVRIEELQNEISTVKAELEYCTKQDVEIKKKIKLMELELADAREKLKTSRERLLTVKTNKEYDAVQSEIDKLEEKIATLEEETLTELENSEEIEKKKKELEGKYKIIEEQNKRNLENAYQRLQEIDSKLEAYDAEWASIAREIPADILEEYKMIRKRQNIAVASVTKNSCGACFAIIPPNTIQALKRGDEIIRCYNCGRFLIWEGQD